MGTQRVAEIRQLRIEVGKARADLTKHIAGGKLTKRQNQNRRVVVRLVGNKGTMRLRNFLEARSNLLKMKVAKVREARTRRWRKVMNSRYRTSRSKVLVKRSKKGKPETCPTKEEITEFWGGILGVPGNYDLENPAIAEWLESCTESEDRDEIPLSEKIFAAALKQSKNWKAAGRDGTCKFW